MKLNTNGIKIGLWLVSFYAFFNLFKSVWIYLEDKIYYTVSADVVTSEIKEINYYLIFFIISICINFLIKKKSNNATDSTITEPPQEKKTSPFVTALTIFLILIISFMLLITLMFTLMGKD